MQYKKVCKICNCVFYSSGPAGLYCPAHTEERMVFLREKGRLATAKSRAMSGQIKNPGVGKGGNPLLLDKNPQYKHGFYVAERQRSEIKSRRYCERCQKDLVNSNRWQWCVHHKDHNHCNHDFLNLELLCKRCHQIEHECYKAFTKGATTIPKGSTSVIDGSAQTPTGV